MVIRPSTLEGRVLSLHVTGKGTKFLLVDSVTGSEAISQPYQFNLKLLSKEKAIDSAELLDEHLMVSLVIKRAVPKEDGKSYLYESHRFHGVFSSFVQRGELKVAPADAGSSETMVIYDAVLVPRVWTLSQTRQSRIFQGKTVPDIVETILREHKLIAGEDYDFTFVERKNETKHPKHEFVVQFEESDLDFLSRKLEHEGISYFFHQSQEEDGSEKLIFTDKMDGFSTIHGGLPVPYRTVAGGRDTWNWVGRGAVNTLIARHDRRPKEVLLSDWNYRKAGMTMTSNSPVESVGGGKVHEHGAHFKTKEEGKHLAKIRAEELACRERLFSGNSNQQMFRAGHTFQVIDHYREDFNQEYLITEVQHEANQEVGGGTPSNPNASYRNDFIAVPLKVKKKDIVFRPERITPKPKVEGSINAKVDLGGDFAALDKVGRYKVKFPFDLAETEAGKASRQMRKVEPYGGPGYGMHFPLHNGVEVVMSFVNGDPDRPIIMGSIANSENASSVAGGNNAQCVLSTGGDNKLVIDDDIGRIALSTPSGDTYFKMGAETGSHGLHWHTEDDGMLETDGRFDAFITKDYMINVLEGDYYVGVSKGNRTIVVDTGYEHVSIKGEQKLTVQGPQKIQALGAFQNTTVAGNQSVSVAKDQKIFVGGKRDDLVVGKKSELYGAEFFGVYFGAKQDAFIGAKFTSYVGKATSTYHGIVISSSLALKINHHRGPVKVYGADKDEFRKDVTMKCKSYILDATKGTGDIRMKNADWELEIDVKRGFELSGASNEYIRLAANHAGMEANKKCGMYAKKDRAAIQNSKCKIDIMGSTIDLDASTIKAGKNSFKVK